MLQGFCGPDLRAEERGLQPPPTPGPKNGNRAGCLQSLIIPAQSRHSGQNVGPRIAVPRCPDTGPAGSSARFLLASDECPRLYGPSQCCLAPFSAARSPWPWSSPWVAAAVEPEGRPCQGSIPHVLVLDAVGKPLYNSAGEVDSKHIEAVFAQSFNQSGPGTK